MKKLSVLKELRQIKKDAKKHAHNPSMFEKVQMKRILKLFRKTQLQRDDNKINDQLVKLRYEAIFRNISYYKENITWNEQNMTEPIFMSLTLEEQTQFLTELMTAIEQELKR